MLFDLIFQSLLVELDLSFVGLLDLFDLVLKLFLQLCGLLPHSHNLLLFDDPFLCRGCGLLGLGLDLIEVKLTLPFHFFI